MKIEYCFICDSPTGRAGRADDSLYDALDNGPYCENCYGDLGVVPIDFIDKLQTENARIAELEEAQRWIPVGERLPENTTRSVLTVNRNGFVTTVSTDYFIDSMRYKPVEYTHWMPLPSPPKEQG